MREGTGENPGHRTGGGSERCWARLHHQGSVAFFLFGLVLLVPLYGWLRRGEPNTGKRASVLTPAG